ncbi:MAG: hypothetical protein ACI9LT_003535 [Pseudoalteromonas distincta]|jgi:hypothetical protein
MTLLNYLSRPEQDKFAAWQACSPVQGLLPSDYRVDADGNIIRWADYGSQSQYGWEIDHVLPSALGGASHASNYRALHWKANRSRGGVLGNALKPRGLFGWVTR